MRIGLHVRTGGGYAAAIAQAKAAGATALQVFSSNPRTYRTSPIDVPALEAFARQRREADLDPCVVHTPYLINFASDDPKIYDGSLRLLRHDLQAAAAGSMRFVDTQLDRPARATATKALRRTATRSKRRWRGSTPPSTGDGELGRSRKSCRRNAEELGR